MSLIFAVSECYAKKELVATIQAEFITHIHDVSGDLNMLIVCPDLLHCVQLVASLGPCKAAGLIKVSVE